MSSTGWASGRVFASAFLAGACALIVSGPVSAQGSESAAPRNWSNSTELSWVFSKGNSNSSSFSVRNVYKYAWERADLYWEVGILRAASVDDDYAVGTESDFQVVTPEADLDHNRATSKLRYTRALSDRFFWYLNWDSSRDKPSNIDLQLIGSGGVGHSWYDRPGLTLRTGYGLNYTTEDLDFEGRNSFAGYRLFYRAEIGASDTTSLESELTFDGSFETGDDIRFDSLNSVTVAMGGALALKGSLRFLFRNLPALDEIDLVDPGSGNVVGEVIVPKKRLDTTVSMSLVITF